MTPITDQTARRLMGIGKPIAIVIVSAIGGVVATMVLSPLRAETPFDYEIYMQGARMFRAGLDPYATLPFWYPLPIVLFTLVPWSLLPDQFWWAFALIPLGLLHLHFGRRTAFAWLFYPLLISAAYGQAESWLVLPLVWLLRDEPIKSSFAVIALMFKPAYAMFLAPYRVFDWVRGRRWSELTWLTGLVVITFGLAFLVDGMWLAHWLTAIQRRAASPGLIERNMTIWAFPAKGALWLIPLALLLGALVLLAIPALRGKETRGDVLLATSLFVFPDGLYPVSAAMVLAMIETRSEILALVVTAWVVVALEVLLGDFGGLYLVVVLIALTLRQRRYLASLQ